LSGARSGRPAKSPDYVFNDNLSGSNIVTDQSGNVVEALDCYPYGGIRLEYKSLANATRQMRAQKPTVYPR
jgi:hypothetical protein